MKTKIFFGCLMAASLLTTSCSDFLTEDPQGKMIPETYFTSQEALNAGVYALYHKVNQTQSWTNPMYPQWQGDDLTANPGSNKQAVAELDGFSASNNNKGVTDAWTLHYTLIKAANLILDNAQETPVSEKELNIALGQAYYWRAYAYYYLVRIFGPLPLVISVENATDTNVALSTVEDVYKQIVEDLTTAEEMLATVTDYSADGSPRNNNGADSYVTKQAVQSTLAAVYMSMAGYPLNKGTEYYKLAAAKAKEVIDNNGTYGFYLESDWKKVYSIKENYNKATVLGIDYSPLNGSWVNDSQLTSCNRFEGLGDGGWGDAWGEIKFWKNYPEGPRKDAIYAPKITFQDKGVITKMVDWWALATDGTPEVEAYHPMFCIFTTNCDGTNETQELVADYDYTKPNYTNMTNGHRHRLIRYSEVLLWYAESAARAGEADLSLAKNCLKQVHNRAVNAADQDKFTYMDGTTVTIDNMSADQLAQAAYEEHGWEVAGYWVAMVTRRSDELRMNELKTNFDYRVANAEIVVHTDGSTSYTAKESVSVTKSSWAGDESIYIPYPDTEVEKNPNLDRSKVQ